MAAPSEKSFVQGIAQMVVFTLDASLYPLAPDNNPVTGYYVLGVQTEELSAGAPRNIVFTGDNRVIQQLQRPSQDVVTSTITIAGKDDELDALLNAPKAVEEGNARYMLEHTNKEGCENLMAVILYTDGRDENGNQIWEASYYPVATLVKQGRGRSDDPAATQYVVTPSYVTKHLWGPAFTTGIDGATRARKVLSTSSYAPVVSTWLAAVTDTQFVFDTDLPPASTDEVWIVTKDGVELTLTTDYTLTTTEITLVVAATGGEIIQCWYGTSQGCGAA